MDLQTGKFFGAIATGLCLLAVEALAQGPAPDTVVDGVIVDGGVVCPLLQTKDGLQISLQGVARDRFPAGTCLNIEGRFVRVSKCMQGARTLWVRRILDMEDAR